MQAILHLYNNFRYYTAPFSNTQSSWSLLLHIHYFQTTLYTYCTDSHFIGKAPMLWATFYTNRFDTLEPLQTGVHEDPAYIPRQYRG